MDRKRLEDAARSLIGNHDFSAFAKSGQPERGVRCEVKSVDWRYSETEPGILEFEITADPGNESVIAKFHAQFREQLIAAHRQTAGGDEQAVACTHIGGAENLL